MAAHYGPPVASAPEVTPRRLRERVLTQFRSPENLAYLEGAFRAAFKEAPPRLRYVLSTLPRDVYDFASSFGQGGELHDADPLVARGANEQGGSFLEELHALNRAFFDARQQAAAEHAGPVARAVAGAPEVPPAGLGARELGRDGGTVALGGEPIFVRGHEALSWGGHEGLNGPGPYWELRENQNVQRFDPPPGGQLGQLVQDGTGGHAAGLRLPPQAVLAARAGRGGGGGLAALAPRAVAPQGDVSPRRRHTAEPLQGQAPPPPGRSQTVEGFAARPADCCASPARAGCSGVPASPTVSGQTVLPALTEPSDLLMQYFGRPSQDGAVGGYCSSGNCSDPYAQSAGAVPASQLGSLMGGTRAQAVGLPTPNAALAALGTGGGWAGEGPPPALTQAAQGTAFASPDTSQAAYLTNFQTDLLSGNARRAWRYEEIPFWQSTKMRSQFYNGRWQSNPIDGGDFDETLGSGSNQFGGERENIIQKWNMDYIREPYGESHFKIGPTLYDE